jgi:hypothetical protein
MRKFLSRAFVVAGMLAVAACGGGGGDSKFETPGQTGGSPTGSNNAAVVTVTSSVPSISSSGSGSANITAMVRDSSNNLIKGVPVTFTASSGGIAVTQNTTDESGQAKATLVTAGDASLRTITVTASAGGGLTATVAVQVVAGGSGTTTSAQMGSGTGTAFQPGVIAIANPTVAAGGSTSLQVVLQQTDGTLYTQPATITFSSPCVAQGLANVGQPVATSTGIASATYAATGCSGDDVITATATVSGQALSSTGTVNVASAAIGSIVYVSASPTNIALKGTGDSTHPEASTVIFRVLDATGGPRAGATVTFSLNTSVGGITVGPLTAQSGSDGRVQTVVNAGTVATSVRVTATVTSVTPNIGTQSSQLTVTTGIPDQDSFSLAVQCQNVEAWHTDGVIVPVTARLADRFNNPVPDGTAVTLTAEGGKIQSQCTTATTTSESGVCSVNWVSSEPRPADGRVSLLATAIGEESFNDANGNGSFDNGETFTDLGERYLDVNENDAYDAGEPIYDFNNNSTRDAADGKFNGVLCLDNTGRCDASATTTGISSKNVIIMSDGTPVPSPASGSTLSPGVGINGTRTYFITFKDVNGNPLPSGSTISAALTGTGLTLGSPSSFTVPCTTGPTTYPFTITAGNAAATGTLTITVTSKGGIITILSYPVTT